MIYYKIRHHTRYRYTAPVGESVMEVRMQPRSEDRQRCHSFDLKLTPPARLLSYTDHLGNTIHFFDIPRRHGQLVLRAESQVAIEPFPELPDALSANDWAQMDALTSRGEFWDMIAPSHFVHPSPALEILCAELGVSRNLDPMSILRHINTGIYFALHYVPNSTEVDSDIDVALESRQGVCQDYAHIMLALVRGLGIPCRYVSGYLFHDHKKQEQSADDSSHAWIEAYLPHLGWVGFDPANNILSGDRHIAVAIGRDYANMPPTRGVFRGNAKSHMDVGVQVTRTDSPEPPKQLLETSDWDDQQEAEMLAEEAARQQQQQQQQ